VNVRVNGHENTADLDNIAQVIKPGPLIDVARCCSPRDVPMLPSRSADP